MSNSGNEFEDEGGLEFVTTQEFISDGTYGKVYDGYLLTPARQRGERCAVKVQNIDDDGTALKRELETLQKIKPIYSQYLMRFFGFQVREKGRQRYLYLAMERGDRTAWNLLLDENKTGFVKDDIIRLVSDCANGLISLHRLNIGHRDIKASNILVFENVAMRGKKFRVFKLCDYGTSKCGTLRTVQGTPEHLCPELFDCLKSMNEKACRGKKLSEETIAMLNKERIDFWSLGTTIMHCATAIYPFPVNHEDVDLTKMCYNNMKTDTIRAKLSEDGCEHNYFTDVPNKTYPRWLLVMLEKMLKMLLQNPNAEDFQRFTDSFGNIGETEIILLDAPSKIEFATYTFLPKNLAIEGFPTLEEQLGLANEVDYEVMSSHSVGSPEYFQPTSGKSYIVHNLKHFGYPKIEKFTKEESVPPAISTALELEEIVEIGKQLISEGDTKFRLFDQLKMVLSELTQTTSLQLAIKRKYASEEKQMPNMVKNPDLAFMNTIFTTLEKLHLNERSNYFGNLEAQLTDKNTSKEYAVKLIADCNERKKNIEKDFENVLNEILENGKSRGGIISVIRYLHHMHDKVLKCTDENTSLTGVQTQSQTVQATKAEE